MALLNTIELYNLLRNKIGEKEAQALTEYISVQVEEKLADKKDVLATKQDIFRVENQISDLKVEMKEQKADLLKCMIVLFAAFYIGMIVFLIKQFL